MFLLVSLLVILDKLITFNEFYKTLFEIIRKNETKAKAEAMKTETMRASIAAGIRKK